ncbi:UNVERIFIED_CONTAM: hypothetical protein Sradi_3823300 [Sesamum radiatum]|uniref:Uncharacterized protein n=1 Tax=Sesamum radiatum TaxID=300843 RepID=A0AAW2Q191_SESRA
MQGVLNLKAGQTQPRLTERSFKRSIPLFRRAASTAIANGSPSSLQVLSRRQGFICTAPRKQDDLRWSFRAPNELPSECPNCE